MACVCPTNQSVGAAVAGTPICLLSKVMVLRLLPTDGSKTDANKIPQSQPLLLWQSLWHSAKWSSRLGSTSLPRSRPSAEADSRSAAGGHGAGPVRILALWCLLISMHGLGTWYSTQDATCEVRIPHVSAQLTLDSSILLMYPLGGRGGWCQSWDPCLHLFS